MKVDWSWFADKASRLEERFPRLRDWVEAQLARLERQLGRPDIKNKVEIYEGAGEVLSAHCGVPREEVLAWLLARLEEEDAAVHECLAPLREPSAGAAASLRETLLGLEVSFQLVAGTRDRWQRVLTVYLLSGATTRRHRRTAELAYHDLPDEVRERRLSDGATELTFSLLPAPTTSRRMS